MILASAAPPGSTIGVVTPATPPPRRSDVLRGIEWWEANGYRVKLAPNALERCRDFAGTPEARARDLQELFADPGVHAIQTMRGGYGSAEVVPILDYDAIAASPKPFLRFSDITGKWRDRPGGEPRQRRCVEGDKTGEASERPAEGGADGPPVRTIAGGRASGPVVGGCLPDLVHTFLTSWEVETEGAILFFEVAAYGPTFVDRHLVQLRQAGKLEGVAGIVVGELPEGEWGEGLGPDWPRASTLEDVLEQRLGDLGVPVFYGLPIGHGETLSTLPLGVRATLDADALTLTIDEPALTT